MAFSKIITSSLGVPLFMQPKSFIWAYVLADGLRLRLRALSRAARRAGCRRWKRSAMSERCPSEAIPISTRSARRSPRPSGAGSRSARTLALYGEVIRGGFVELWAHKLRSTLTLTLLDARRLRARRDDVGARRRHGPDRDRLRRHELGRHRHDRAEELRRRRKSRSASR